MTDLEWIEWFYTDIEHAFKGADQVYKRPADYIERGLRVLQGKRKTMRNQVEGRKPK